MNKILEHNWKTKLDVERLNQKESNSSVKTGDGFQYEDVQGLSPKEFAFPRGNERLRESFVGWRKDHKHMNDEQAQNEIVTESEFNQIVKSEAPIDNLANPDSHKELSSEWKAFLLNKNVTICVLMFTIALIPSYFLLVRD